MDEEGQTGSVVAYSEKEICDLLTYYSHNTYSVTSMANEPRPYMTDALKLMEKDYIITKIENKGGNLCPQYPAIIPIMESARRLNPTIYENESETCTQSIDTTQIADLFEGGKLARCRQRFPIPVILINGKYVCRSSTLASEPEMCYRTGLINVPGYELLQSVKVFWWPIEGLGPVPEVHEEAPEGPGPYDNDVRAQTICDRVRNIDIKLLKRLNVNTIVDIMVEKRKVKHRLYVSASEKVDLNRYSIFKLISLPYPGCEFFKDYHDAMFRAEGLKYKWDHPANDAVLSIPNDNIKKNLAIPWLQYKEWDLVGITQNYMKYILKRLQDDKCGLLLHCISGWDRTPLFISLIRLSLWADSLVHPTLNEYEILYFTLVYDWYLFGHHLNNRLYKNEEIMAFCFDFLRYMTSEDFSSVTFKKKYSDEMKTDESRSPSRSSNSSVCTDENIGQKKKKVYTGDYMFTGMSENSNDSCTNPADVGFDGSNSPRDPDAMDTTNSASDESKTVLSTEDALMEAMADIDDPSKNKLVLSPSNSGLRTSPIPVGGAGSRRQRSESTGSNSSNISANWQIISDCGSVERETHFKPQRVQRLEKVRTIFNSCYQKTVKNESFGPPKKWMIEEIVGSLSQWSQWSHWLDIYSDSTMENSKNGNAGTGDKINTKETNGNGTEGEDGIVPKSGGGDKGTDNSNSNE